MSFGMYDLKGLAFSISASVLEKSIINAILTHSFFRHNQG